MKTVIIEDEYPAAERLQRMLVSIDPTIEILTTLESVSAAKQWFGQHPHPKLILSDIQLSDGLSFEIFEAIGLSCPIIFTTAYDEYAIKAFKVRSVDYLLKPIKTHELSQALTQFHNLSQPPSQGDLQLQMAELLATLQPQQTRTYKNRFLVKSVDKLIPIVTADIAYFYTSQEIVYLVRQEGRKHAIDFTMDQLQALLDPTQFYRVNRQFLCQITAIHQISPYFNGRLKILLTPPPEDEVLISREKARAFKVWLGG